MNRKHLLGIGLLSAAATLLTGCLADTVESTTDLVPISLTSVVEAQTSPAGRSATRTTATDLQSDQLPSGEPFYVRFSSGVKQLSGADLTGTTFTADGNGGTSSVTQQPFFARSATSATLHAYHGMSGGTAQVTEETNKFAVALDQSGADAYKASDLLYATTSVDKAYPSVTAALQFTHKMSKVMVSVTLGAGISSVSAVRIIGGTKAIAIANPATTNESSSAYLGAASADEADQLSDTDGERIILYSGTYNDQNTALECAGLIPPQTITGNFLQVVTSAGTATYSLASKTFAAGENYTYNILVNPASLGITTDITDWDSGSEMNFVNNGTAKMYYCHGTTLADATVGMIICEHGKAHEATSGNLTTCSGQKVAIVAYKGSAGTADKSSGASSYVGLALAITDVGGAAATKLKWITEITESSARCTIGGGSADWSTVSTNSGDYMAGIDNTKRLAVALCGEGHVHAAAQAALDYDYENIDAHPTGTSQWFLPTIAQWKLMLESINGSGTLSDSDQDTFKSSAFRSWFDARGGKNFESGLYWSSVESDTYYSWCMNFGTGSAGKGNKTGAARVRPVLAF